MYRKVAYRCCGLSPSDPCFSYMVVEFRDDCLEIVECSSDHTHSNQSVPWTPPFVILTGGNYVEPDPEFSDAFKKLFESATFTSFEMLQKHLEEFQETTGACYIRRHTTKLPDSHIHATTCVYRRLTLECKRSGTFKSRSERGVCGKSKMINCPAKINFVYENGVLKILNYNLSHNHLLVPSPGPKKPRSHKRKTIFKSETGLRNLSVQIPALTASTILRRRKRMLIKDSVYNPESATVPARDDSKQPIPQLSRLRQLMTEVMNHDSSG
nr:Transcription factor FAR1 [Hymenolepis microstoma]